MIDPWKNRVFCVLAIFLLRWSVVASANQIRTMIKSTLGLCWCYALVLVVYVKSSPNYPGSIQRQLFLSGLLGFVVRLLLLSR